MLQAGCRLGLPAEALDEVRVLREAAVQQLERDLAPELLVLGQEHVRHAPAPEAGEDLVARVDGRAGCDFCHERPSESRTWSTDLAIGAATVAPKPPLDSSTITAIATFGCWAGAKATNAGWVRFEPFAPICAVPVLPAIETPGICTGVPVPSSTTFSIICVTPAAVEELITWLSTVGLIVCTVWP